MKPKSMSGNRTTNARGRRWLSAGLLWGALIGLLAGPAHAQPSRSREDLVAKLAGKLVRIDANTKQVRAITTEEARELIAAVQRATETPDASSATAAQGGSSRMLRLGEHAGHIVVVRPNEDGTLASRCVGSADEAVAFLTEDPLPLQ